MGQVGHTRTWGGTAAGRRATRRSCASPTRTRRGRRRRQTRRSGDWDRAGRRRGSPRAVPPFPAAAVRDRRSRASRASSLRGDPPHTPARSLAGTPAVRRKTPRRTENGDSPVDRMQRRSNAAGLLPRAASSAPFPRGRVRARRVNSPWLRSGSHDQVVPLGSSPPAPGVPRLAIRWLLICRQASRRRPSSFSKPRVVGT